MIFRHWVILLDKGISTFLNGEGNGTPLQYSCLENPRDGEPGRLQSMGSLESDTTERLHFHFSLACIEEGNGNPLQCSCLENPRDGGAWWAAVYGVTQSRTRLKQLSSSSSSSRRLVCSMSQLWYYKQVFFSWSIWSHIFRSSPRSTSTGRCVLCNSAPLCATKAPLVSVVRLQI